MKSRPRFGVFRLIVWLVVAFLVVVLFAFPLLTTILVATDRMPRGYSKFLMSVETIQTYSMRAFTVIWIFFVGSCFASFLNVVAWRVSRGRSILGSSSCPYCNQRLAFRDNFPIVGWLRNRGRCRTCRLPISPRYLIAEVILGSVFLLLALIELATGGINLPFRPVNSYVGFEQVLFDPQWDLILIVVYHLILLSILFTFALVEAERLPIPPSILWFALALGLLIPFVDLDVLLVGWKTDYAALDASLQHRAVTLATGGTAGLVIGCFIGKAVTLPPHLPTVSRSMHQPSDGLATIEKKDPFVAQDAGSHQEAGQHRQSLTAMAFGMTLVGVYLGWQSAVSIAVIYQLLLLIGIYSGVWRNQDPTPTTINHNALLMLATFIHIVSWRVQTGISLGLPSKWIFPLIGILLLLTLAAVSRRIVRHGLDRSVLVSEENIES